MHTSAVHTANGHGSAMTTLANLDLDDFIAAHHARLIGLLTLRTGSRVEAEDLAQDALLKLVQRWDQIAVMDHPWAWLAAVAVNLSTGRWRRLGSARRATRRLEAAKTELADSEEGLVDLLQAIEGLPERQRKALLLRHYAQLSVRETAEAMNCAPGTVKALTHQATQRLREQFTELTTPTEETDNDND